MAQLTNFREALYWSFQANMGWKTKITPKQIYNPSPPPKYIYIKERGIKKERLNADEGRQ